MKAKCEIHGEYEQETLTLFGKPVFSICPKCQDENDKMIQERSKQAELERKEKLLKACGIPERFKNCTLDNYRVTSEVQDKAYKGVLRFVEMMPSPFPLFLCGSYGTGKTHLAVGVIKSLLESGKIKKAQYITTMKMIREIRATYHPKSNDTEQAAIDRFVDKDLLVLDEVGLQNGTDNEKLLIYEVLNGRYENLKPTVLISNLPYAGLTDYLGERVIDRLKDKNGVLAIFNWGSERGKI